MAMLTFLRKEHDAILSVSLDLSGVIFSGELVGAGDTSAQE
jgi:hypothetical protein